jgi:hypothetical protein
VADFPAGAGLVLERLRERLARRPDLVGIYVYGSLVTGDYSPARSDLDVVVLLDDEPDAAAIAELAGMHAEVAALGGPARQLNCLYVAAGQVLDPERLCTYWFGEWDRMTQWQLKVLTRAELAAAGVALHGPWPPPGTGPVPVAELQAAVLAGLRDHWRGVARQRKPWLDDDTVDRGLVVLPRAEAVLARGELITKGAAIGRLGDFGVPAALAEEIRGRRAGQEIMVSRSRRRYRAWRARRIMLRGVRRLSRLRPAGPAAPES